MIFSLKVLQHTCVSFDSSDCHVCTLLNAYQPSTIKLVNFSPHAKILVAKQSGICHVSQISVTRY